MASSSPLTGVVLVDCARANAKAGLAIAAEQCGYGNDTGAFQSALQSACTDMGVSIDELADLIAEDQQQWPIKSGFEVSPETPSDL